MEEYPKVEKRSDALSDEVVTHPAFAQIRAGRVSGNATLYGSDFNHQHFISVTVSASEHHRGLGNDRHFEKGELLRLSMSEAQWATFVSSIGVGSGSPCTVEHVQRDRKPNIKRHEEKVDTFSREIVNEMQGRIDELSKALAEIEDPELNVSKKVRGRFQEAIKRAKSTLTTTIPFMSKQFDEHTENTIEKAKIEINAYMTNAVQRAGLKAIKSDFPLMFENDESDT